MTHSAARPPLEAQPPARRWRPFGQRLARLRHRLVLVWKEIWDDNVLDRAAALSYYFMFALFPMLLVVVALLGLLRLDLTEPLMESLNVVLPTDVVQNTVSEVIKHANTGLLSFGIAAALWSASSGMSALMGAVNAAFDLTDHRPWWKRQLIALGLTAGAATMIPLGLLLLIFGDNLGREMANWGTVGPVIAQVWAVARWVIIVALLDIGFNLVYYWSLAKRPTWRLLTPGSTFAVGSWLLMSLVFRLALQSFIKLGTTYGSIGGVIALLLWLYYTGVVVLIGAEIDSEIGRGWEEVKQVVDPTAAPAPATP